MNFFVATIGRSGSTWLSSLLNKSQSHTVMHEEADPRDPALIYPHSPFPIKRFSRPNYGEVHGFLRYHLSAGLPGAEKLIPRRALMLRDTRDVIKSWMNRDSRTIEELSAVIFEVTTQERLLREWAASDPEVRVLRFEQVTKQIDVLRKFCLWLEIDFEPTKKDMIHVVNPNVKSDHWFDWNDDAEKLFKKITRRQGRRDGYL